MTAGASAELTATCVLPARAQLGECPLWSAEEQRLYWVDIDGRSVHRFDPSTGTDEQRAAPGRPGSIAFTHEAGRLLVAIETRLSVLDWRAGRWTDWMALEPPGSGNRLNDGRCDPAGRLWVGSMYDPAAAKRTTGLLHRVGADGRADVVRTGIGVPNGIAFAPDGRTMYFADTSRDVVWAYDYDPATGEARGERPFVDFRALPGRPDGASVDTDGGYWIACVYGSVVLRIAPDGSVDRQVTLPVTKPTMPAFGGPDRSTLFVTTIGGGGSHPVDPSRPLAGGLFAIETDRQGLPEVPFGGPLPAAET